MVLLSFNLIYITCNCNNECNHSPFKYNAKIALIEVNIVNYDKMQIKTKARSNLLVFRINI